MFRAGAGKEKRRVGGIVLNMSISGLNQRKSRDLERPLLAELCFFPACKDSTCFRSSVLSQNILCPFWLFSVPPLYSLGTGMGSKGSRKGFQANAVTSPLVLTVPCEGQSRRLPTFCSCTQTPAVQTLHAASHLSRVIVVGLCSDYLHTGDHFVCLCTRTDTFTCAP